MNSPQMRVVTIIAEATREAALCGRLRQLGAKSYSVVESAKNFAGKDCADSANRSHIRIDSTVSAETAHDILDTVQREYGDSSSIICFISDAHPARQLNESIETGNPHFQSKETQPREMVWGDYLISL